jgi:Rrf2 family protein
MTLNKMTRYALYAAMEMARAGGRPLTVSEVAAFYGIPESALAKVFQHLVRMGLAQGIRGVGGGYRLAGPPSDTTVLDIIHAYEPPRNAGHCLLADTPSPDCGQTADCRLRRLFDEVDEMARCTLASVTLETLVKGA